jgi:regulator of nucleoside diphosphate kinase
MNEDINLSAFPTLRPPIVISAADRELLTALLVQCASTLETEIDRFLREELERADTVYHKASSHAVGIGSEVSFINHEDQRLRIARVVGSDHVENSRCISVLTPIGSALIGLGPGQTLAWRYRGRPHAVTVLHVGA